MAAVRRAIADGADWVEIDVQESRDGHVVVFHDSDFMKLSGNPLKIWDGDLADIQKQDIGSWFGPEFAGERVPTLAQVLEETRGRAGLMIELKYYGHDQQLEQRVVDIVESAGMVDEVSIMSLKLQGVQKLQALRPDWKVGLLAATAMGDLAKVDVDFLAVSARMATTRFIRRVHASDKRILVWTVNDALSMSKWMSMGVDGVITDEPALAGEVLRERAQMSTAERLLVSAALFLGKPVEQGKYRDDSP
jgi:glycerophosphoryl diester phosphodiesterase